MLRYACKQAEMTLVGIQSPKLVVVWKKKLHWDIYFKLQVWCVHGWVIALVRSHIRQRNVEARGVWDNVLVSFTGVCRSSHAGTGSSMFFVPMCFFFPSSFHTKTVIYFLIGKCPNLYIWKYSGFCSLNLALGYLLIGKWNILDFFLTVSFSSRS